jgi:peptidoglycan LD-endopeptidase CwlK
MMSRLLADLDPRLFSIAQQFIQKLIAEKVPYAILETYRPPEIQAAYYAQGRETYNAVCAKRLAAGLPRIGEYEAGQKVTWTLKSKHISGLALDVVPLTERGAIPWRITDATAPFWKRIGEIGESVGLEWGGRWPDQKTGKLDAYGLGIDLPHYELADV